MLDLSVIIVNYNTRDRLHDCLESVFDSQGDLVFQVWVVDNASDDGSVDMVQAYFPQVHLIANEDNRGYPQANNQGLRAAGFGPSQSHAPGLASQASRYALLLNADTVLPSTALAEMVSFMDAHPQVGAAGPKLVMADGSLDLACRRSFPTPGVSFYRMVGLSKLFPHSPRFGRYNVTYLDPDETAEVDAVVGAFMIVRGEAIQRVGLLDESFFMYGEDLDWCYRLKQAGWKVVYYPGVTVLHYKRESSKHSRRAQHEFNRAMEIFYRKHYAADTPLWLHWLILSGIALREVVLRLTEMMQVQRLPLNNHRPPTADRCQANGGG